MTNPATPLPPTSDGIDFKEYIAIVLKRKWIIMICFLLTMSATTAFISTRQEIYQADVKLLVSTAGGSMPVSDVTQEGESQFYATQINILLSQSMLRRVQERLKKSPAEIKELLSDYKVDTIRGSSIILIKVDSPSRQFAVDFGDALATEYFRFRDEQRMQDNESALQTLTHSISQLGGELKAAQERYITFAKEHDLPMLNDTAGAWWRAYYIALAEYAKLKQTVVQAKAKLAALEQPTPATFIALASQEEEESRVADGRAGHVQATGGNPAPTDVSSTNDLAGQVSPTATLFPKDASTSELSMTQSETDTDEVLPQNTSLSLQRSQSVSSQSSDSRVVRAVSFLPAELTRSMIDLERRRVTLEGELEDLKKVYKERHPAVVAVETELTDVRKQIRYQMQFAHDVERASVEELERQYEAASVEMKRYEAEGLQKSTSVLDGRVMADDVERVRTLDNALTSQLLKLDMSQSFKARNVSVLENATLEPDPIYPNKTRFLLVSAFFGFGMGLAIAFFVEFLDDSIKLAEEVERELQLPFLGMIPAAQWNPDDLSAHRLDKLKQQGGVAESYRVVRSAIIFSTPRDKLRSMLVTSAVPREGKTTTCVNLAIGFSQVEDRVLLIDADLRRGEVHKYFGFDKDKGLADILLGEATAEEVIKRGDVPKLDVITCGAYPANPAELLLGWRLKEFLDWAYKHYDRVVVDCPPIMGIADSAILGSAVDGVLFIIWAGRTSRRYVRVAKMTAVSRGAKVFGFVLNNLEPGRVGYYHYYPYYYSYYSRGYYYANKEDEGKGGDIKGVHVPTQEDGKDEIDDVY